MNCFRRIFTGAWDDGEWVIPVTHSPSKHSTHSPSASALRHPFERDPRHWLVSMRKIRIVSTRDVPLTRVVRVPSFL